MERKTIKRVLQIALLVILVLQVLQVTPILADVGNSFSGGESYDSNDNFSYSSSGDGIDLGLLIYLCLEHPIIAAIVIIVLVVIAMTNKNKVGTNANRTTRYVNPGFKSNNHLNESEVVARIKANDPNFSQEEMISYANEVWLTLQEAWEKKTWQQVRPFESNTLFNIHNRQLQEFIDNHMTNYLNKQNIRSTILANYHQDENHDILDVKLDASLLDYTLDDESGRLLEGSKEQYVHRSYHLQFIRKIGSKTNNINGTNVTNCPNCGAPTQVTSSGQCEYCKSVITNGDYGWVLNKYEPW